MTHVKTRKSNTLVIESEEITHLAEVLEWVKNTATWRERGFYTLDAFLSSLNAHELLNLYKEEMSQKSFVKDGVTFRVGDDVEGEWVNMSGEGFDTDGKIIYSPLSGFWVQSQPYGGITHVQSFTVLEHRKTTA